MNEAEMLLSLYSSNRDDLAEICYNLHKDQYGTKGYHLTRYSIEELVGWMITHYYFDEKTQCWNSKFPLDG